MTHTCIHIHTELYPAAAAAAKSLHLCPTLCDPIWKPREFLPVKRSTHSHFQWEDRVQGSGLCVREQVGFGLLKSGGQCCFPLNDVLCWWCWLWDPSLLAGFGADEELWNWKPILYRWVKTRVWNCTCEWTEDNLLLYKKKLVTVFTIY